MKNQTNDKNKKTVTRPINSNLSLAGKPELEFSDVIWIW